MSLATIIMLSFYKPQDKNDFKPATVALYHFSVTNTDFMIMQVPCKVSSVLLCVWGHSACRYLLAENRAALQGFPAVQGIVVGARIDRPNSVPAQVVKCHFHKAKWVVSTFLFANEIWDLYLVNVSLPCALNLAQDEVAQAQQYPANRRSGADTMGEVSFLLSPAI